MVREGEEGEGRGQGEYPILTLVRLVRRARLVKIHEAPPAPMPFRLCVCVRVRACVRACVRVCVCDACACACVSACQSEKALVAAAGCGEGSTAAGVYSRLPPTALHELFRKRA